MLQIVYTSTANQVRSSAELERLLAGARRRNRTVGVTGMLVFHDGIFLQALEGETRAVNEIFVSILGDARHHDVTVLHRGPGREQRVFGDWPMGFTDFAGAVDILKGFCASMNGCGSTTSTVRERSSCLPRAATKKRSKPLSPSHSVGRGAQRSGNLVHPLRIAYNDRWQASARRENRARDHGTRHI